MKGNQDDPAQWRVACAVIMAVGLVALISVLPLKNLTGGRFSDFNLLADVVNTVDSLEHTETVDVLLDQNIDPLLRKAIAESRQSIAATSDSTPTKTAGMESNDSSYTDLQDTVNVIPEAAPAVRNDDEIGRAHV